MTVGVKVLVLGLVVGLAGCVAMAPYNQSQDDLRASPDKFGGKQLVEAPISAIINNSYQVAKHCDDHPIFAVAPDGQEMTATAMISGWSAPAYLAVIDVVAVGDRTEVAYWGQNSIWRQRASQWIEQLKNPGLCKSSRQAGLTLPTRND